jgi:hypothetical protein
VIFALLNPVCLAGLLLGFGVAMVLRGVVQRAVAARAGLRLPLWNPRLDFDVFGIVSAVIGGTGWGHRAPVPYGRPSVAVLLSGPLAVIAASQAAFGAYVLAGGHLLGLYAGHGSDVLRGEAVEPYVTLFLLSLAVAMLYAGILAFIPLPPLDGWGLLARRFTGRRSEGWAKAQLWLEEKNIGVVILLLGIILPPGQRTLILYLLDVVTIPVFNLWSLGTGAGAA